MDIEDVARTQLAVDLSNGRCDNGRLEYEGSEAFGEALRVQRYRMGNGLTILLLRDPIAPVVAYHTWFHVGSRDEMPGKTGIAHLFEHLMFTETESLGSGEFDREMEELGADSNAATWMDWTQYHVAVPRQAVARVVELESERMGHLTVSQSLLDSEKEVVANERRYTVEDDVEGAIGEQLWATAFENHSYRWPTIGWMKDIKGFTVEDCRRFYRTYYSPNNATVVVAGDFEEKNLLRLLQAGYEQYSAIELPVQPRAVEPPQVAERRIELTKLTPTWKLSIGYKTPRLEHADHWLLTVVCEVLFGGRASRIVHALVSTTELATDVRGSVTPLQEPGLLEVFVTARPGRTALENLECLDIELQRVADQGISEAELGRARARVELSFLSRLDTADAKASTLGFHEVVLGQPSAGFSRLEELKSIRVEDVLRAVRTYLNPESRTVILVQPKTESE